MIVFDPAPPRPIAQRPHGGARVIRSWHLSHTASSLRAFQPRGAMGRWNHLGVPVVQTAPDAAAAALELVAAWGIPTDLQGYWLHSCTFKPEVVEVAPADLDLDDLAATRSFGSDWARSRRTVVLRVPSAVIEGTVSYLINPRHPESADDVWLAPRGRFTMSLCGRDA